MGRLRQRLGSSLPSVEARARAALRAFGLQRDILVGEDDDDVTGRAAEISVDLDTAVVEPMSEEHFAQLLARIDEQRAIEEAQEAKRQELVKAKTLLTGTLTKITNTLAGAPAIAMSNVADGALIVDFANPLVTLATPHIHEPSSSDDTTTDPLRDRTSASRYPSASSTMQSILSAIQKRLGLDARFPISAVELVHLPWMKTLNDVSALGLSQIKAPTAKSSVSSTSAKPMFDPSSIQSGLVLISPYLRAYLATLLPAGASLSLQHLAYKRADVLTVRAIALLMSKVPHDLIFTQSASNSGDFGLILSRFPLYAQLSSLHNRYNMTRYDSHKFNALCAEVDGVKLEPVIVGLAKTSPAPLPDTPSTEASQVTTQATTPSSAADSSVTTTAPSTTSTDNTSESSTQNNSFMEQYGRLGLLTPTHVHHLWGRDRVSLVLPGANVTVPARSIYELIDDRSSSKPSIRDKVRMSITMCIPANFSSSHHVTIVSVKTADSSKELFSLSLVGNSRLCLQSPYGGVKNSAYNVVPVGQWFTLDLITSWNQGSIKAIVLINNQNTVQFTVQPSGHSGANTSYTLFVATGAEFVLFPSTTIGSSTNRDEAIDPNAIADVYASLVKATVPPLNLTTNTSSLSPTAANATTNTMITSPSTTSTPANEIESKSEVRSSPSNASSPDISDIISTPQSIDSVDVMTLAYDSVTKIYKNDPSLIDEYLEKGEQVEQKTIVNFDDLPLPTLARANNGRSDAMKDDDNDEPLISQWNMGNEGGAGSENGKEGERDHYKVQMDDRYSKMKHLFSALPNLPIDPASLRNCPTLFFVRGVAFTSDNRFMSKKAAFPNANYFAGASVIPGGTMSAMQSGELIRTERIETKSKVGGRSFNEVANRTPKMEETYSDF